jgi:hypothetical protein
MGYQPKEKESVIRDIVRKKMNTSHNTSRMKGDEGFMSKRNGNWSTVRGTAG